MPSCCVMCCGCQRLMDQQGKATIPFALGGLVDVNIRANVLIVDPLALAKVYPDHETADTESRKLGWVVVNGNHRCPECWKQEQAKDYYESSQAQHGAYIDLPQRAETPVRHKTEGNYIHEYS